MSKCVWVGGAGERGEWKRDGTLHAKMSIYTKPYIAVSRMFRLHGY